MDEIDQLLERVKHRARGWMSVPIYRRLYETAAQTGGGTIVEIGTYCGAATVAMALGAASTGESFQVITADLLRPGVGLDGQDEDEKTAALQSTLREFGAAERVRFVHGNTAALIATAQPTEIRMLLLDGGGWIETDLALLWVLLAPDATIVIDDIDDKVFVRRNWRTASIDQKHRISSLLVDIFVAEGLLIVESIAGSTGWFRKGGFDGDPDAIRLMALPAYHELIRTTVSGSEFGLSKALLRGLAARAPWLRRAFRRFIPPTQTAPT